MFGMVVGLLLVGLAAPVLAQDQKQAINVELNRLEPSAGTCRAYVVIENATESAFSDLRYDLVIFDDSGIVARRLALETAPLPAGKTSLKVFDLADLACDRIGRILINDILECADTSGTRDDCLALLRLSSRSTSPLIR